MADFKIITITGPDGTGKTTQARLLQKALKPSDLLAFPDNHHWSGRIIRAILAEQEFRIDTRGADGLWSSTEHLDQKEAIPFQYLQAISRLSWRPAIEEGLKSHHWVMARYDVDAIAYGCAEGTPLDLTLKLIAQDVPSDLVIVLDGKGFGRPEALDRNDRDPHLQGRVRDIYHAQVALWPEKFRVIAVDPMSVHEVAARNIHDIHRVVCREVAARIGAPVTALPYGALLDILALPRGTRVPATAGSGE